MRFVGAGLMVIGVLAMVVGIEISFGSQHLHVQALGLAVEAVAAIAVIVGLTLALEGWFR